MQTELNAFVWWDWRNGTDVNGTRYEVEFYGWRNYGDFGMINGLNTRHPTFYAAKLIPTNSPEQGLQSLKRRQIILLFRLMPRATRMDRASLLVLNKVWSLPIQARSLWLGSIQVQTLLAVTYGIPKTKLREQTPQRSFRI